MGDVVKFPPSGAEGGGRDTDLLAGIDALAIVFENLDEAAEEAGLNRTTLQVQVEEQLLEAGIRPASLSEALEGEEAACLFVSIGTDRHESGIWAVMVSLKVGEGATLWRDEELSGGVLTWTLDGVWLCESEELVEWVEETLREGVGRLAAEIRNATKRGQAY